MEEQFTDYILTGIDWCKNRQRKLYSLDHRNNWLYNVYIIHYTYVNRLSLIPVYMYLKFGDVFSLFMFFKRTELEFVLNNKVRHWLFFCFY